MSITMQINPFDFFADTQGDPLDAGYIWIGQANLDPRQYPVAIYYDSSLTIPAPMPLRTRSGYVYRNGSPTFLYVNGNYSVRVEDKNNRLVFYVPDFQMVGSGQAATTADLAAAVATFADTTDPAKGDALIGVKQPYTGAVGRTQHDKNAEELSSADFGLLGDGSDEQAQIQAFVTAGAGRRIRFVMTAAGGIYGKSTPTRILANTEIVSDPGVVIRRLGTTESWMFVNGVIGDANYATAYNGDSNIRIIGNTFDLNGIVGVRTAAALVLGHSRGLKIIGNIFKNGYNSHNIEINANADAVIAENVFQDQAYDNITQSFEAINIDYANAAGFPGWGEWDNTPDMNIIVRNNTFRNVQGGVSSHSVPVGAEVHTNIQVLNNTFQDIGGRAVRAQGWNNSKITGNLFINIGQEAINVLTGNKNIVTGNIILGASTSANGLHSAIRLQGDENFVSGNIIDNTGYANSYAYPVGIASGTKNTVNTTGAKGGSSFVAGGMVSDGGTLTNLNGRTLLFSGDAIAPVTITLADNINFYEHLEVTTGQVGGYTFQSHLLRPFARGRWTTSDKVVIQTVGGVITGDVASLTSFNILADVQHIRAIYGVLP
jgi:hypothetical protein